MQRIFLPKTAFGNTLKITDKNLYHQITRVMRARVGQKYIFFDGSILKDREYKIDEITKHHILFTKTQCLMKDSEITPELHLYQAFPNKLSKMEYIIQKCSEIGYKKIHFFQSEHSQSLVISEGKEDRLKKISQEAIEQCGGNIIPELIFKEDIQSHYSAGKILSLVCDLSGESKSLSEIPMIGFDEVHIYVGPEGGFSEAELAECNKRGFHRVSLGDRVLRAETVGEVLGFYVSQNATEK